jgi:hypothetical protein
LLAVWQARRRPRLVGESDRLPGGYAFHISSDDRAVIVAHSYMPIFEVLCLSFSRSM